MKKENIDLIDSLIMNKIIELGIIGKDHRTELEEYFYERIRKYGQARDELMKLKEDSK